jgi:hypothetical protein
MDQSHDEDTAAELLGCRWYSTEELANLLGVDASSIRAGVRPDPLRDHRSSSCRPV